MSIKTLDHVAPLASPSGKNGIWNTFAKSIAEFLSNLERAIVASELVERGVDPREAYKKVYKDAPSQDL